VATGVLSTAGALPDFEPHARRLLDASGETITILTVFFMSYSLSWR
jgi:hypothetical protein